MTFRCLLAALLLLSGRAAGAQPLSLLDVPYISQSEALCGGAAAAMVLRYWGVQGLTAESFSPLVDRSAAGIRTDVLTSDIRRRGFAAFGIGARGTQLAGEIALGRPVIALIEDRPGTFHYVVVVAWHERGVVFHDPARAPFQVMPADTFDRRWQPSGRWMLVIVPDRGDSAASRPAATTPSVATTPTSPCDVLLAAGVRAAQANQLDTAERQLTEAIPCAGAAAYRELAGVRLMQRRWDEVATLAEAAVRLDDQDAYAWKLLGTAHYVANRPGEALAAWNHAGEPRLDLIRIEGLQRTRQRVVEQAIGVGIGDLLRPADLLRAQRRLADVPSFSSSSLRYTPMPGGAAQLVASVAERPLFPRGVVPLAIVATRALIARELSLPLASPLGAGERLTVGWRFWPNRPRYVFAYDVPGAWSTTWQVAASREKQPFTGDLVPAAERTTATVAVARWQTSIWRWSGSVGADRWRDTRAYGRADAGIRLSHERFDAAASARMWAGGDRFTLLTGAATWTSTTDRTGLAVTVRAAAEIVSEKAPPDLWRAGDTGHARSTLLRAHPVLDAGRLRTERLGRALHAAGIEAVWWMARGPVRFAPAAFLDVARTSRMSDRGALTDTDAGVGVRAAVPGLPGTVRLDVARGLRDGATALSLVYEP